MEALARRLSALFINRDDTYAIQLANGEYSRIDERLTLEALVMHLKGEVTIGIYPLDKNQTKVIVFDIDEEHVPNPAEMAVKILREVERRLGPGSAILEASRWPDPSYHIWACFDPPIPAKVARWMGREILKATGAPKALELFPKQDEAERFGNCVKLPLGLHQVAKKWSRLLDPDSLQPLPNEKILEVRPLRIPEVEIEKALKLIEAKERGKPQGIGTKPHMNLRPCFTALMEKTRMTHEERVALVNELAQGYSIDEVKRIFHEHHAWEDEYDPAKTDYQIESIYGHYGHFTREELKERGICLGAGCERFEWEDCRRSLAAERYFTDGKFIPMLLAEELMQQYHFITMRDNEEIYVWRNGYYRPYAEALIREECKIRLGEEYRSNRVSEVIDYIKASTYRDRNEEPPHLIPLQNGILNLNTLELKPHSPEYLFFNLLPVAWNPEARCPKIMKFLTEITGSKEDIDNLLEVIGFCLYREYFIAKALMLVGEGANGKSTFLNLVKSFLGRENVSGRSLQDLEENRFAKADLYHKLANIYADLPDRALWHTGIFKMLTGRDLITGERKFQQSFTFENYAKLLFSANKVPEALDDTEAFFRRWLIMVFPNQFTGDRADPYILKKLTEPEELSGLLNLAIEALRRLLARGEFSYSKTMEAIKEDYIRKSSPVAAFIMDCIDTDSDAFIEKKQLYNVFAEYCRVRGLPTLSQDTFFKKLPAYIQVADFRATVERQRLHTLKGLRYRAEGWSLSNLSNVSKVFYTLREKREDYKPPYKVVELADENYLKVEIALDRVDTLDRFSSDRERLPQLMRPGIEYSTEGVAALGGWPIEHAARLLKMALEDKVVIRTPSGRWMLAP